MRQVYIEDGEVRFLTPAVECTEVSARWCPIHGNCTGVPDDHELVGPPYSDHCSDENCPLHGRLSRHAETNASG